jgi:acetyl-CoA acetyltransferase
MQIELDMFSGVENPRWEASPAERETIADLLARLPPFRDQAARLSNGLGYRGFRIIDPDADRTIIVQRTTVVVETGARRVVSTDSSRDLEQALVRMARTHLSPDIYTLLLDETGLR